MSNFRTTPGNLVRARGRDWVVQAGSDDMVLILRPLRGSDEVVYIALRLRRNLFRRLPLTIRCLPSFQTCVPVPYSERL